jgi:glutamate/tyrosine decarboxylase-like PLP-dependent enzyme
MTKQLFPTEPLPHDDILKSLENLKSDDLATDGRAFAFVYSAGEEVTGLARKAFAATMGGNGLDPTVYPSARRLENSIVAVCLEHLNAPEGAVGSATSGGTESVLLAVKTARDYARATKPHIEKPTILVPETAHASFHKAAHYFGVDLVLVDVDPETMEADVDDMAAKLDANTILLVASAPSYAHGVIDPIARIGALAEKHDVLFHVDACIGGWVLPFERDIGVDLPAFDFEVAGVTSMSVDLHKYGFTPKGLSVLLQRTRALRDAQYYACANWTGYSIVNATMQGSKSLAPLGAAWAVLRGLGRTGYRDLVSTMWKATEKFVSRVGKIDGLRVIGKPSMGLLAVTADSGDVFALADRLSAKGWEVQPTYAFRRSPAHIHFTIDPQSAARVDEILDDLAEAAVDLPAPLEPPTAIIQILGAVAAGGSDHARARSDRWQAAGRAGNDSPATQCS